MITATGNSGNYTTELSNGIHTFYADAAENRGGTGLYPRPTDILASAYASCINITTRMVLDREGWKYEKVTVYVDMDKTDLDNVKFFARTEIEGDILQADKDRITEIVKRCPVCRILKSEKEFLPFKD